MDIGLAIIYSAIFVTCVLTIIGFILLCKFLPDVQSPFKKTPSKGNIPLNVVEPPRRVVVPKPVEKKTLKDAWNVISQEAKKELPTIKVKAPVPVPVVAKPLQPMPIVQKPTKRKLTAGELARRKISTKPGSLK